MSTLALPISQLLPVVGDAKRKTECVVVCSRAETADRVTLWNIARKTLALRWLFADLVRLQDQRIGELVERDFSAVPSEDIKQVAAFLEKVVSDERDLLSDVHGLGSELRFWWNRSLIRLAQQVEHLDSIAESLRVECDDEASALLGMALSQVATPAHPQNNPQHVATARFAMK